MQPMYPGKVNSPQTELASAIDDEQTTIPLLDASVLPDPPNICTIGTGEDAETVLYEGKNGNDLTGVTRGFQGAAKSWGAGVKVARLFTEYDYDALRQNILSHASRHAAGGPDEITPASIGAASQADFAAHKTEIATKFTNLNLNIVDMAIELETLKGATLNGVTANIFIETFQNLDDINLERGSYNQTQKRLEV